MTQFELTPKEIVHELDKHVIGQDKPKRFVAIAMRNRWRRMQLDESLRDEVMPKNILMIGPTGVGKTEIARRLSKLAGAPFLKVEATKFTEVGYVGRDVDSIIRDLAEIAVKMEREESKKEVQKRALEATYNRILNILIPPSRAEKERSEKAEPEKEMEMLSLEAPLMEMEPSQALTPASDEEPEVRQHYRKQLLEGKLDDQEIEIDLSHGGVNMEIMGPPGMEEMTQQLQDMFQHLGAGRTKKRKLKIKEALKLIQEEEADRLVNEDDIKLKAIRSIEQHGIVFIDEIDKVCKRSDQTGGGDVSREGVQRDLLPLVEGCTVSTKYGMIKTDHILFIASGAFHVCKPSDLIPELQGRFPIRVELEALTTKDFVRILTEPSASLIKQYIALLATEGFHIQFEANAIERIAEIAWEVNESLENIGARRLHTVIERLLENLSFDAGQRAGETFVITKTYVNDTLSDLVKDEDLSRFIL